MTTAYAGTPAWVRLTDPNGVSYEPERDTFYLCYRGSIAHGMFIPADDPKSIDDIDLMGFAFGAEANYFGLKEWGSRGTKEIKQGAYDVVIYEARKAVSLLLQGNPNILSMLWMAPQHILLKSPGAEELIRNRHLFIGKHVYNAFAGYAYQQLTKMDTRDPAELRLYLAVTAELKYRGKHPNHKGEMIPYPKGEEAPTRAETKDVMNWVDEKLQQRLKSFQKKGENIGYMGDKRKHLVLEHGYDAKNAAHLIRLLRMCIEFMNTGELLVQRPDAAELIDIKRGKWKLEQVKQLSEELFAQAKVARDKSPLPDEPDREGAEALLVKLIRERLAA